MNIEVFYGRNRTILITGASSGIGASIAKAIAPFGANIALVARREEKLKSLRDSLRGSDNHIEYFVADVCDLDAVKLTYKAVVDRFGKIDVAYLNAGRGESFRIDRFSAKKVKETFDVNIYGVVNFLEVLLPSMLEKKEGTIVGISSLASHRGAPMSGVYSASKAALSNLLESLRIEAAENNIQITTVEPGFVRSELTDKNKFKMPFFMETEDAAKIIIDGVSQGKSMIRFPWEMSTVIKLLSFLPNSLYDSLSRKMLKGDSLKENNQ